MLFGKHVGKWAPLFDPAGAPPDGVFLPFHLRVAVPAHWAGIRGNAGFNAADLGMVTPRDVVVEKAQLPSAELESAFRAGQPGGGEHVSALFYLWEVAEVVARRLDFPQERATL